ncbi:MAG: glycoside hydrolase family 38 C-terminal domain-containing protein, partial [bacterium]
MRNSLHEHFEIIPLPAIGKSDRSLGQVFLVKWENIVSDFILTAKSIDPPGASGKSIHVKPGEKKFGELILSVPVPDGIAPGHSYRIRMNMESDSESDSLEIDSTFPDKDRLLFAGPGYHVDPVWWNTERDYTEVGSCQPPTTGSFIDLNEKFLAVMKSNPEFSCALETVPALYPSFLMFPKIRNSMRSLAKSGRLELIGSYDEPQSTIVGCELLCRNIEYGIAFAKEIFGVNSKGLAQWDVFGHDPIWPSLGRIAGLNWTTFARGVYYADPLPAIDNLIPSEFMWMSPDGNALLAHYMTRHYTSGWEFSWKSMADAEIPILKRFKELAKVAPTHNTLLPCYADFGEPFEGMCDLVKEWNEKYLSPKIIIGTQSDYLNAVKKSCEADSIRLPVISADFNPALSGCNISFIDTKLAQHFCERFLRDAEIWSTAANLLGVPYPLGAIDRAWRILNYTAHHDAVTGSESDQVYIDLCALWREAFDNANEARNRACEAISGCIDSQAEGEKVVTVFNSLPWPRNGDVKIDSEFYAGGVPALGWKTFRLPKLESPNDRVQIDNENTISNEFLKIEIDPDRGGAISSIVDLRTGKELIKVGGVGNDIAVYEEYRGLELQPWLLQLTGKRRSVAETKAHINRIIESGTQTLTASAEFIGCIFESKITLRSDEPFIDFEISINGYSENDLFIRTEFPLDLPGTVPVAQTSGGVIGRSFARHGDYFELKNFGDWAIDTWGGLECPMSFKIANEMTELFRTVSVCEIVTSDEAQTWELKIAGKLVRILALCGVTSTVTRASGRRSGDWLKDGSHPDFRISLGSKISFASELIEKASVFDPDSMRIFNDGAKGLAWIDIADTAIGFDKPVIVFPNDSESCEAILNEWSDAIDRKIEIPINACRIVIAPQIEIERNYIRSESGCAFITKGIRSMAVHEDRTVALGLLRSASGCPSGEWIDKPRKKMPDESNFQHEHFSHRFEFRLMPHAGDWRDAGVSRVAEEFNQPLIAFVGETKSGKLPNEGNFLRIESIGALIQSIRPYDSIKNLFDPLNVSVNPEHGLFVRLRETDGSIARIGISDVENIYKSDFSCEILLPIEKSESGVFAFQINPWSIEHLKIIPKSKATNIPAISPNRNSQKDLLYPSRYWRSGLGPENPFAQPIFIRFLEKEISLGNGEKKTITIQIASNVSRKFDHPVRVEISSPKGVDTNPSAIEIAAFDPEETIEHAITISEVDGQKVNGGFISAVLSSQVFPRFIAALPVNRTANLPAPVDIRVPEAVIVSEKGVEFEIILKNLLGQYVEGFLELITPLDSWPLVPSNEIRKPVTIPPSDSVTVNYRINNSKSVVPGRYWAIAKWHSLEEQAYSDSLW